MTRHRWTPAPAPASLEWDCVVCGVRARGPFRIESEGQMDQWLESRSENRHISPDCDEQVVREVMSR